LEKQHARFYPLGQLKLKLKLKLKLNKTIKIKGLNLLKKYESQKT
jgi:hypothetical protein